MIDGSSYAFFGEVYLLCYQLGHVPYARPVLPFTTFEVLCIRLDATSFPNSQRKRRVALHQGRALDIYQNMYRPFEQELSTVLPINRCV